MNRISIEVWPPRNAEEDVKFCRTLEAAKQLDPPFVSVTVSDRRPAVLTRETAVRIQREFGLPAMAHIRCFGLMPGEFRREIELLVEGGIRRVLVIRGDKPSSMNYAPFGTLEHASDGVRLIREMKAPLLVGVGCHPDVHEEALSADLDLFYLEYKIDLGADLILSQAFFDVGVWSRFVTRARDRGIDVPMIPGVLPLYGLAQVEALCRMSRARPSEALNSAMHQSEIVVGKAHTLELCRELLHAPEAPGLHLFTFNRPDAINWLLG